jgi:sigma-B regulation protein RsbU (phosphoserine phosphatase)
MKLLEKIPANTLKLFVIIISVYTLLINGVIFLKASLTDSLTVDDIFIDYSNPENHQNKGIIIWEIKPGGRAGAAGLQKGDVILRINNDYITDANQYRNLLNTYQSGNILEYLVKRGNDIFSVNIQVDKYFHFIYFLFAFLGFGFLFNSIVVGLSRPEKFNSFLFFLLGVSACLGFNIYGGAVYYSGFGTFIFNNFWLGNMMFYPLILHFFLTFPVKYEFPKRKFVIAGIYMLPLFLIMMNYVLFPFDDENTIFTLTYLLGYVPFTFLGLGILFFVISYFRIKDAEKKKPLKIILYGMIAGFLGFLYYFFIFNPYISPRYSTVLLRLPALAVLTIPVSYSYSILKYKILYSGYSLKRNILTVFVSLILILIFLIIINLVSSFITKQYGREEKLLILFTVIIFVFLFDYINKSIRKAIDNRLLRNTAIQRKLYLEFTESLPYFKKAGDISERLVSTVKKLFRIGNVKLWINRDAYPLLYNEIKNQDFIFGIQDIIKEGFFEGSTNLVISGSHELFGKFNPPADTLSIVIFPIGKKAALTGAIILYIDKYDLIFSDNEYELMETISYHAGAALENARLRLEELKKMKFDEELAIAKHIQSSLVPEIEISNDEYEIISYNSLSDSISGNFFDIIRPDKEKLLLVLADTSGTGIPAALLMSKIQSMTRFAAKYNSEPKNILKELNKNIYGQLEENTKVTMILALFDMEKRKVTISNAGHNYPLLYEKGKLKMIPVKGVGLESKPDEFNTYLGEYNSLLNDDSIFLFYNLRDAEPEKSVINDEIMKKLTEFINKYSSDNIKKIQQNLINSVYIYMKDRKQNEDLTSVFIKIKSSKND